MDCDCHCIKCGSTNLISNRTSEIEQDGYFDAHHTCKICNSHFDHLEGELFDSCKICKFGTS